MSIDVGHRVHNNDPEAYADLVLAFLAETAWSAPATATTLAAPAGECNDRRHGI